MANEIGVSLRAYQEWEAGGGIKWGNLQRLPEVHGVTPNYILYGEEEPRGPKLSSTAWRPSSTNCSGAPSPQCGRSFQRSIGAESH
jgi:hypothetical protein